MPPTNRLRSAALIALFLLTLTAEGSRRRAVRAPEWNGDTPEGWLGSYAAALTTVEGLPPSNADLRPLKTMIHNASIVGLGEPTHGSHESMAANLRIIEFLVREMNFDSVAVEASFPILDRIDAYVQGEPGDLDALVRSLGDIYPWWGVEEFRAVVEWMREYNAHRGNRPAVHIAGADVYEPDAAADEVLAWLRTVDPAAAADAETRYACVRAHQFGSSCLSVVRQIRESMVAREAELIAKSSAAAYHDALQYALVIEQRFVLSRRDAYMAANILWVRQHRSVTGKTIAWAHNGHVARATTEPASPELPFGQVIAQQTGPGSYYAIGSVVGNGTFRWWKQGGGMFIPEIKAFDPPLPDAYSRLFRRRPAPALVIPINGPLPPWFPQTGSFAIAGSGPAAGPTAPLSIKTDITTLFDAVVYIDQTTPSRPLTHQP